jgi:hypothetical protein
MTSKRNLMTVLIGLAMLAAPITAAAKDKDHDGDGGKARSHAAARNVAPAVRNQRGNGTWASAPAVAARRDWREDRNENNGRNRNYANYGNRGYYGGPAYNSAPYYGNQGYGYAGGGAGACNEARRIRNTYIRDRNTGHPAAASDLLSRLRRAESACGGVPYGGGSGLGGNGYGYNQGYGYGNNGYGYNQPGYGYGGNNGYNQGYGYGGGNSMLAPLIQQFVR